MGNQSCKLVPRGALREFLWREPLPLASTRSGREVNAFKQAVIKLSQGVDGQTFARLVSDPDYSARYDQGYDQGRHDGAVDGLAGWYTDYADVVKSVASALITVLGDLELSGMLVAATIEELFLHTKGSVPVWKNPKYARLLAVMRPQGTAADKEKKELAEMLQAAAWADAMARVPERIPPDGFLDELDFTLADWLAEIGSGAAKVAEEMLVYNCQPYDQGNYVGLWVGHASVNTVRSIVESQLRSIAEDPSQLFLPIPLSEFIGRPGEDETE